MMKEVNILYVRRCLFIENIFLTHVMCVISAMPVTKECNNSVTQDTTSLQNLSNKKEIVLVT